MQKVLKASVVGMLTVARISMVQHCFNIVYIYKKKKKKRDFLSAIPPKSS